jgi:hypothetical protein
LTVEINQVAAKIMNTKFFINKDFLIFLKDCQRIKSVLPVKVKDLCDLDVKTAFEFNVNFIAFETF